MFDIAFQIVSAIVAAVLVNEGVRLLTDRSIPEHLQGWWNKLMYELSHWVEEHQHLGITRIVAELAATLDSAVIASGQTVKMLIKAETQEQGEVRVSTRTISADQLAQMFPEAREQTVIELTERM